MQGKSVLKALTFVFCCYTLDKQHREQLSAVLDIEGGKRIGCTLMDAPNRNAITSVCHRVHIRTLPFL